MADISFTGKDKISVIHLPESSEFPLGGSINITDLINLTELYDQLGSAGKDNELITYDSINTYTEIDDEE